MYTHTNTGVYNFWIFQKSSQQSSAAFEGSPSQPWPGSLEAVGLQGVPHPEGDEERARILSVLAHSDLSSQGLSWKKQEGIALVTALNHSQ